jgi:hypothetical protein
MIYGVRVRDADIQNLCNITTNNDNYNYNINNFW